MTRPNCMRCGHPVATPDDWRDIPEGDGDGLCWSRKGEVCEKRLPVIRTCGGDCRHSWVANGVGLGCVHPKRTGDEWRVGDGAPPSWCPLRGEP